MANQLHLKRSAVQGKVPTIGNLQLGELAVNTFDGKIFIKRDNGTQTIQEFVTIDGIPFNIKFISGLVQANNSIDPINDIDISVGKCRNDTNDANIELTTLITKRMDAAWVVGSNLGGLDTGTVANSNWYYIWAIKRSDTSVNDILFSLSNSAPTMPANYDSKRLIGAIFRNSLSSNEQFKSFELGGGGVQILWISPTLDVDLSSVLTTTRRSDVIKVPLGFPVEATININIFDATVAIMVYISNPDVADLSPSSSAAPLATNATLSTTNGTADQFQIWTNNSGQISAKTNTSVLDAYRVSTIGYKWGRI